jgi:hypothetical protein
VPPMSTATTCVKAPPPSPRAWPKRRVRRRPHRPA